MGLEAFANNNFNNFSGVPAPLYAAENEFMQLAIDEARIGIYNHEGGPFGAVIIKDGKIIGTGHNQVLSNHDSTCHGEIQAIRNAEKNLGTHDLQGAVLYTTGEPCPMCLSACLWANIEKIFYGCTVLDNEEIGFRDKKFDKILGIKRDQSDYLEQIDFEACHNLFEEYKKIGGKNY